MSESAHGGCNCGSPSRQTETNQKPATRLGNFVKVNVPQGHLTNLKVSLVPAHTFDKNEEQPPCRPRKGTIGWQGGTPTLNPALINILQKADAAIVNWLSKDSGNAEHFIKNPLAAMRDAGVKLNRAEEKMVFRAHEAAHSDRVVIPGSSFGTVVARAFPQGRVGSLGGSKLDDKTQNFNCAPKRKG